MAIQMVRFCFSKGEPLWLKTFRWGQRCLLLQLRKNNKGRFIVLSLLGNGGKVRTVIFPEGAKAEGWFGVTKVFKETLIEGHKKRSLSLRNAPIHSRLRVSRDRSFASVVRGHLGGSPDSSLMGWKCRECGSWDVCAAVIGEAHIGSGSLSKQKVSFKDNVKNVSVSLDMMGSPKECVEVSPPYINQFQVLRDLLENYPSSDCEYSSPGASRVPESPLNVVEEELRPAARSPATTMVVYSRRKKSGKTKLIWWRK